MKAKCNVIGYVPAQVSKGDTKTQGVLGFCAFKVDWGNEAPMSRRQRTMGTVGKGQSVLWNSDSYHKPRLQELIHEGVVCWQRKQRRKRRWTPHVLNPHRTLTVLVSGTLLILYQLSASQTFWLCSWVLKGTDMIVQLQTTLFLLLSGRNSTSPFLTSPGKLILLHPWHFEMHRGVDVWVPWASRTGLEPAGSLSDGGVSTCKPMGPWRSVQD